MSHRLRLIFSPGLLWLCDVVIEPLVETETIGRVLLVGINRPDVRNCVNQATAKLLCETFSDFEVDNELRVAVLYGKGMRTVLQFRQNWCNFSIGKMYERTSLSCSFVGFFIKFVLLTGGNFCAGYDLGELSDLKSVDDLSVSAMIEKGTGPMVNIQEVILYHQIATDVYSL